MTEKEIRLSRQEVDRLLEAADGTAALLLLHVRRTGAFSLSAAVRALGRNETEIRRARETLLRMGLLEPESAPLEEQEMPEYSGADIAARTRTDPDFEGLVQETNRALGRLLGGNDLRLLFGIYDHLGLPADVIMLLLHHCIAEYRHRYGEGRVPTMRYIERAAWRWAGLEILTLDDAEAYIQREEERKTRFAQITEVLQIRDRALSPTERSYVESWLSLGFGPEAVAIAYDRTLVSTGRLVWKYMNTILQTWAEKRLFTPEEIEAGDPRRASAKAAVPAAATSDNDKLRQMQKMYERLKGKEN